MAGAKKPEPIKIVGGDGNIYVVETWNRGTIADGDVMTEYTIRPICEAIQGGTSGLSAETERAMAAESGISAIVDKHYDEYNTFISNEYNPFVSAVNTSAESLSARLAQEILDREDGDDDLQEQIDTLKAATDVIMVYGDYQTFTSNSGDLVKTDADVIKVLVDENKNDEQVYYQWYDPQSGHEWSNWSAIGSLNPYYSKSDLNNAAGKNINITTANGIKINTNDNVVFTTVSSNGFSGTNLSGASKHDTIDNLFGSAYSGVAASAYITTHSADFLNSAHSAYNKLTFKYGTSTKEYPATNSNYNFTFLAGQGIGFTTANNQVTISAEGTTYQAGSYISTANKTIAVTGSLLTSAKAGSAASAWINNTLFDYSYTDSIETETSSGSIDKIKILYKNDVTDHDVMYNQEVVFERGEYPVSGLLIQAAKSTDDGKVLTYNSTANNYTWQPIPPTTYSNDDGYISINNSTRKINLSTTGIKTSAYSAEYITDGNHYNSILNGGSLYFSHGTNSINIALTGVSYYAGGTNKGSANWDNLFQNYAQVNRVKINTTSNLTADKVNFIVATGSSGTQPYKAVNFVVTSTLPTRLESDTYYIV
jgi:hypothetical protein